MTVSNTVTRVLGFMVDLQHQNLAFVVDMTCEEYQVGSSTSNVILSVEEFVGTAFGRAIARRPTSIAAHEGTYALSVSLVSAPYRILTAKLMRPYFRHSIGADVLNARSLSSYPMAVIISPVDAEHTSASNVEVNILYFSSHQSLYPLF